MSHYLFNKVRYEFFARHLRADKGIVKQTKSCDWIVEQHRLGRIKNNHWLYTDIERQKIIELVEQQLQVNLLFDEFPEKQSRLDNAVQQTNEKQNALTVTNDFVLVNAIKALRLNQQQTKLNNLQSLGLYVNAQQINSIEHSCIVLVENLTVMAHLQQLNFTVDCEFLRDALWVYRGDIKAEQSTSQAYAFFRQFEKSHQLICFSDFDPEGFNIAISSGAHVSLVPTFDALQTFTTTGAEKDFYNQLSAIKSVAAKGLNDNNLNLLFQSMCDLKKTIKQEHILSHKIPLTVLPLK